MKKIIFSFFTILFLHLTFTNEHCKAQWQPDVRLTVDPANSGTSYNNAWCIAVSGNVVHTVWYDDRHIYNKPEIYYKRSTDGGLSWGADTRLTNDTADSWNPSIAVSGSNVHLVWYDKRDGNYEIYYKRSNDGGLSWGADTRLTNDSAISRYPSIAVTGTNVHVVWNNVPNGYNYEIYYKRSTDGGINWETGSRISIISGESQYPSIAVSGSNVHVVWYVFSGSSGKVYYKGSTDGGINWGVDTRLTYNATFSEHPSIAVAGSNVHVIWQDDRDGETEIYYKPSSDGGINWGPDTRLTNNPAQSNFPSIAVSGSNVHVVWYDQRDGMFNYEIYYKSSFNGGINWGTDSRLTNNSSISFHPSIAVTGSVVHVVWQDTRDGNYEVYYKQNPNGNPMGIKNINSEIPKSFSLSQNYPNPFNPETNIKFDLPKSNFVSLKIYDAIGRELETLINENLKAGIYQVDWNGSSYSSGVYYYKLIAGDFVEIKKMILVK